MFTYLIYTHLQRNGTTFRDGTFNSYTGETDYALLDRVHTFNNQTQTHFGGSCGDISGSADGFFPSLTMDQPAKTVGHMPDSIDLYTHQACRSMTYLKADESLPDYHGLQHQEYQLDPRTFANGSEHETNSCFENNLPSGVQNNSYCGGENVPLYLSLPHFYQADGHYLRQFSNKSDLNPNKASHQSFMRLDPVMSTLTKFKFGLQLNVKIYTMPE